MGRLDVPKQERTEIIAAEDTTPGYRIQVKDNSVRVSHNHSYVPQANEYPPDTHFEVKNREGKALYAWAEDGEATLKIDDNSFRLVNPFRTGFQGDVIGLEDSSGSQVDPATESTVSAIDTAVTVLDNVTPTTATDSGTGSGGAAKVDLGQHGGRAAVDIFYDTSGSATLTVEVSKDDSTWRQLETKSPGSATTNILQADVAYRYVRAYLDSNRNAVEISAKGL